MPIPAFCERTIVIVGDIMLDRYFWGDVERISPEAPVPVVKVNKKTMSLGGAGNVAMNLKGLQCGHLLIGLKGIDSNGDHLARTLDKASIRYQLLTTQSHPTTTKTRILGQGQQLVRLDEERTLAVDGRTVEQLMQAFEAALGLADAVIISDYGKGIFKTDVAQRIIQRCRSATIPVFVDPKGTDWERYAGATCITPNTAEFNLIAPFEAYDDTGLEQRARDVIQRLGLEYLLMTRGARGMSLFSGTEPTVHISTEAREVFDVSGAGDTVIAVLAAARSTGMAMADAARLANTAAGIVVGKIGTQPVSRAELVKLSSDRSIVGTAERLERRQASVLVGGWRRSGLRVVFTNGCFDLLHVGHLKLLQAAAALGDRLVVGLNSDRSVRRLKGASRPVVPEAERAALLSGIKGVDLVVLFDEKTPFDLIRALMPDILVKGGDYAPETVVGGDVVTKAGGRVVIVPLVDGASTTRMIAAVRSQATQKVGRSEGKKVGK